jgi:SPOR domain
MANRYQDRHFRAVDDYDHGEDHASAKGESDPLAELARLIGQTDPFGTMGRANQQVQPRPSARDQYQRPAEPDNAPLAGPPPWMQRANRQEIPQQEPPPEYPDAVHPLQRHVAARAEPEPDYHQAPPPPFEDDHRELDPSRYDDALYGQLDAGGHQALHDPAYADDAYDYRDDYDDGIEDQDQKRRGGLATVIAVLALAVVGTGAAFAYRTYVGSPRSSGEPPIIRADTSPTKIVPSPADGAAKLPDRLASGDGTEKIVPREEAPVDVNANAGPRVVFPPLNQNSNPPPPSSVAPSGSVLASAGNGTLPNSEPRKIKTLTVRGDQADGAAVPVTSAPPAAKPVPAARTTAAPSPAATRSPSSAANANASAPLSLVPGTQPAAEPRSRMASNNPAQTAPASGAVGGYLVQVSSQRNEADAQASYRALQGKFPAVLGSHEPVIRRADLGEKGVYYRAMVGPFGTSEEAAQLCGNLKSAGGQCVVQRN